MAASVMLGAVAASCPWRPTHAETWADRAAGANFGSIDLARGPRQDQPSKSRVADVLAALRRWGCHLHRFFCIRRRYRLYHPAQGALTAGQSGRGRLFGVAQTASPP